MSLQNLWQVKKLALNSKSGFNSILFNEKSAAGRLMDFFMSNGKKKASAVSQNKFKNSAVFIDRLFIQVIGRKESGK